MKPNEKITVPVKFGDIEISINDTSTVKTNLDAKYDYILNPTKSTYYVQNILYAINNKGFDNYKNDYGEPESMIKGMKVNGVFELKANKVALRKDWKFGLDELPKEQLNTKKANLTGYYIVRKLHREKDLLNELRESMFNSLNFDDL